MPRIQVKAMTYRCKFSSYLSSIQFIADTMLTNSHRHTNRLINETSPYLIQHAHNPVNWLPWSEESLQLAREQNKLVLVSIGYSACHWCHVMEHESFEDESVANIMNECFVCIKVDREERPDVDHVYMSAVQMMIGSGGWPLNCFTLPDGRPFYGGTYFPKNTWLNILQSLAKVFQNDAQKIYVSAEEATSILKRNELVEIEEDASKFSSETLRQCVANWSKLFDRAEGGSMRAPKFPLPNNYQFLLRYCQLVKHTDNVDAEDLLSHINLTLTKLAFGGIYDHIGGGFSRYSTDAKWKVPHFEKMLYDNAQLVSLYADAFRVTKNSLYQSVVCETLEFVRRELTCPEGGFYAALDADSEGEEGKFYVWTIAELQTILAGDYDLFAEYYNVNSIGYWEHGNYIPLRKSSDEEVAVKFNVSIDELQQKISKCKSDLLAARGQRVRPGLDYKVLVSWNALMISAYCDAYLVFGESQFLDAAISCVNNILLYARRVDGGLLHVLPSEVSGDGLPAQKINGFLEDYSMFICALISMYRATSEEKWLQLARELCDYTIEHFHDSGSNMFYFTSDLDAALITRTVEFQDNVMPSSNSAMAHGLFTLGHIFEKEEYSSMSRSMLALVQDNIAAYGSGYSNWARLLAKFVYPFFEIAIVGADAESIHREFSQHFLTNAIFLRSKTASELPLLKNKYVHGKTLIYVCVNKSCGLPVESVAEALVQMEYGSV